MDLKDGFGIEQYSQAGYLVFFQAFSHILVNCLKVPKRIRMYSKKLSMVPFQTNKSLLICSNICYYSLWLVGLGILN